MSESILYASRSLNFFVFSLESFHAAGGIDKFLFAGKERMTF